MFLINHLNVTLIRSAFHKLPFAKLACSYLLGAFAIANANANSDKSLHNEISRLI